MKRNFRMAVAGCTLGIASIVGVAVSVEQEDVVHIDSATVSYEQINPGASTARVWGDPDSGPHAAFTKLKPGIDVGLHTHTNDVRIVVLKGAYVYKPESGPEIRVTSGQYLLIPGGVRHNTGSDAAEGALFYQEGDAKFDLVPVK